MKQMESVEKSLSHKPIIKDLNDRLYKAGAKNPWAASQKFL